MILTWISADGDEWDLTDENGVDLIVGTGDLAAPPRSLVTAAHAGSGASLTAARWEARTVTLVADVVDESASRNVHSIIADMARRFQGPGTLRHDESGRTRDLRDVYYDSGLAGEEREVPWWQRVVLSLLALDPFWYGDEQAIVLSSPSVPAVWDAAIPWSSRYPWNGPGVGISGGLVWNAALPWDSSLPWNGGQIVSPNVLGDVGSWPRFEFTGPASAFELLHLRTGERVGSTVGLSAGQTLIVETTPGAARGITLGGGSAWDLVSLDSTAEMPLEPGDSLAVVMSGTGVDSTFRVTWTDRWLTPYGGEIVTDRTILDESGLVMYGEDGETHEGEP